VLIFLRGEWHPTLLWPNGWMDEDATWYGSRPRHRPHCNRRVRTSQRSAKGTQHPHVYCGHGCPSQLLLSCCTNSLPNLNPSTSLNLSNLLLKFQQFLGIEQRLLTMQQSMNRGNEGKNMKRERDNAFYTAHITQDHEFYIGFLGRSVTTR